MKHVYYVGWPDGDGHVIPECSFPSRELAESHAETHGCLEVYELVMLDRLPQKTAVYRAEIDMNFSCTASSCNYVWEYEEIHEGGYVNGVANTAMGISVMSAKDAEEKAKDALKKHVYSHKKKYLFR